MRWNCIGDNKTFSENVEGLIVADTVFCRPNRNEDILRGSGSSKSKVYNMLIHRHPQAAIELLNLVLLIVCTVFIDEWCIQYIISFLVVEL